jgi:hypothetical protein
MGVSNCWCKVARLGVSTQTTETYRIPLDYAAGTERVDNWSLL